MTIDSHPSESPLIDPSAERRLPAGTADRALEPSDYPPQTASVETRLEAAPALSLGQQIHEDWVAHGKDWTKPGFRAVAIHRFGVWRMGIRSAVLRAPCSVLYRMLFRRVRNHYGIELPYSAQLGRRVIVEHQSDIVVHGDCVIGDDCILRQGNTLGLRYLDRLFDAPTLGDRVNVGAGAKIFGAVKIGSDVNIGANAVVLCDIPEGATAVGIPARIILPKPSGQPCGQPSDAGTAAAEVPLL
jgi:serine O-acetyltransferase